MSEDIGEPEPIISIDHLARFAYAEMVRKMFELQTRILADEQLQARFGDSALPAYDFMRTSLFGYETLTQWTAKREEMLARDRKSLEKLTEQVRFLETMFAENKRRKDEVWMEAFAEHIRRTYNSRE